MSGKRILIVDDEQKILKLLDIELSAMGYDVIQAENARQAVEKAKAGSPNLILMDVILPDMTGAQAVKILKDHADTKNIPVVFLTAMVERKEGQGGWASINVDEHRYPVIAKPVDSEELLLKVKEALKE